MDHPYKDLLGTLLRQENRAGIRFIQDGVMLKGSLVDDHHNYQGCLMVIQNHLALLEFSTTSMLDSVRGSGESDKAARGAAPVLSSEAPPAYNSSVNKAGRLTGDGAALEAVDRPATAKGETLAADVPEKSESGATNELVSDRCHHESLESIVVPEAARNESQPDGAVHRNLSGIVLAQQKEQIGEKFSMVMATGHHLRSQGSERRSTIEVVESVPYVVWLPYSYLNYLEPVLVSPVGRQLLGDEERDEGEGAGEPRSPAEIKIEWFFTLCLPLSALHKIQRKSNLKGQRVIRITRVDGVQELPLVFTQGGITRFFTDLKRHCSIYQSPTVADDFLIHELDAQASPSANESVVELNRSSPRSHPISGASASTGFGGSTTVQKRRSSSGGVSVAWNNRKSGDSKTLSDSLRSSMARSVYSAPESKAQEKGRYAKLGTTLASAVGAVRSGLFQSNSMVFDDRKAGQQQAGGKSGIRDEDSEEFVLVEPIEPVENQIPRLPSKMARAMGPALSSSDWRSCYRPDGSLDPHLYSQARAKAFYGGIDENVRGEVWCFVLNVFPPESTTEQRNEISAMWAERYHILSKQWRSIFPEQERQFSGFRERRQAIDKDVVRTDRWHIAYRSDDSQKLVLLRNVLMAYAMYNFDLGYCQGMSDVLSVVALMADSEEWAFMLFCHLLAERCEGNFHSDSNMDVQLKAVCILVKRFAPKLFAHLERQEAEGMTFCFRWLLILFKREFGITDIAVLWDVLFCCPYTSQFEVFLTAGLLKVLSAQIVDQGFSYDELLKFANSLAGNMKVEEAIAIAHDFYDQVAAEMVWLERSAGGEARSFRPQLEEVIRAFSDAPAANDKDHGGSTGGKHRTVGRGHSGTANLGATTRL